MITQLHLSDKTMTEEQSVKGNLTTEFYKGLQSSEGVSGLQDVIDTALVKVTSAMREQLLAPLILK